jgi:BNR/Asp-box repeat
MRLITIPALVAGVLVMAPAATASPIVATAPIEASATNPVAGCPPDPAGINFPGSEVEPWLEVNPVDPDNVVTYYQQDRYSNGGSKADVAAVSFDGGLTFTRTVPPQLARCSPGGGPFERATDPWISFGPDGVLHAMTLSIDPDPPTGGFGANAMVYNRSTTGGLTWEAPIVLREDTDPRFLNDKNSITADPNDPDFVYAVWDRLQEPARAQHAQENPIGAGFKGPIWFTRTTNGGDSWEPARKIYETGANKQTIGNQIVVRPQGELFDFFGDIVNQSRRRGGIGPILVSFIVSTDQGATWSKPRAIDDQLPMSLFRADSTIDTEPFPCPDPSKTGRCPIRSGDFIPEVAVNESNGNLYAVWMDARFSGFRWDSIAYSQSTDAGATWSAPIQVNLTPGGSVQNSQAFTPSVDVRADGTLAVTYYDFRENTADPATLLARHYAVHCHAASENCASPASWDEETTIGPAFNIREAAFAGGYFLGDYMGLANDANDYLSGFGSTLGGGPSSIFVSRLTP